eukprot:jgi/Chrzof1/8101/UNPLg00146.t1
MCGYLANPKYDYYCTHCFPHVFPDDPRVAGIQRKTKEIQWVNAILQLPVAAAHDWVWDKPLYVDFHGGCCATKRRIDLRTLVGSVMVAIEIDEDMHKRHAADDEDSRYSDLHMAFSGRFSFLRINSDSYKDNGVKQNPSFALRLAAVDKKLSEIMQAAANMPEDDISPLVQVHHIFYDELD